MLCSIYATAALLVAATRTAADSDLVDLLQPSDRNSAAPGGMVGMRVPPRFHQGSQDLHDDLVLPADAEERAPVTLNLLESMRTSLESEEAISAVSKAAEKTSLNLHYSAPPGSSAIEATMPRIKENSVTEMTALELQDEMVREMQRHAYPISDEIIRKRQRLAHPDTSPAINAPFYTRPTNKQIGEPLDDQWSEINTFRKVPHSAEQAPDLQHENVDRALSQPSADPQSSLYSIRMKIPDLNESPIQIPQSQGSVGLQRIKEAHEEFIKSPNLPFAQSLSETKQMLHIFNRKRNNFPHYVNIARQFQHMAKKMTTLSLEIALRQNEMKLQGLSQDIVLIVEDYWKIMREAREFRSKLSKKGHRAVLENKDYQTMLQNAYCLKLRAMYALLYKFCGQNALCQFKKKPSSKYSS